MTLAVRPISLAFGAALWRNRYRALYALLAAWLGMRVVASYQLHTGFTSLIAFGEAFEARRLPALAEVPIHTEPKSAGYDGQFYAQIAVAGNPFDPGLAAALDAPAYRSRRILMPWLAHAVGLGDPRRVLNVYALVNLVTWLLLAVALERWWFPPRDLDNLLRWGGTLFSAGMMASVTLSLTDGPALLLVAAGVRCVERERRWLGAVCLGAAGLTRETSILAAASLVGPGAPPGRARDWRAVAGQAALVFAPLAVWVVILGVHHGGGDGAGAGGSGANFSWPLAALARKAGEMFAATRARGLDRALRIEVLATVATVVQMAFILGRPQIGDPWWRAGAAFAALGSILGWVVWEGTPGAMTRVLLPLALAFNVLVPRGRRGWLLLLAGNLTIFAAPDLVVGHPAEPAPLTRGVTYAWGPGWYEAEHQGPRTWRWSRGSAEIVFHNPTSTTQRASAAFEIASVTARQVWVRAGDVQQSLSLGPGRRVAVRLGPFRLPPGPTSVTFTTNEAPWIETVATARPLAFSVHGLEAAILGAAAPAPP